MSENNNDLSAPFMTLRDVVMEIRADVKGLKESLANIPNRVDDHEARIRGIEKKLWIMIGSAAASGVVSGSAVQLLIS